jgi:hypothetical protein
VWGLVRGGWMGLQRQEAGLSSVRPFLAHLQLGFHSEDQGNNNEAAINNHFLEKLEVSTRKYYLGKTK